MKKKITQEAVINEILRDRIRILKETMMIMEERIQILEERIEMRDEVIANYERELKVVRSF